MTPVVCGQRQAHAVCVDLSNSFDIVPQNLLMFKLNSYGFSEGCVSWFPCYLTIRQSRVRFSGALLLPFQVTSIVPQGTVQRPFQPNN
jgi:hypothetical protein